VGAISCGRKGEMRWPDLKERKKRKPERALFLPRQFKNSEKDFPLNKAHSRFAGRDFCSHIAPIGSFVWSKI